MMFWYGDGMSGWGYVLMTVGMVVFWGLVITGIVFLVRYVGSSNRPQGYPFPEQRSGPEQVLAERLARGEIDADEYRQRLDVLHGGGHRDAGSSR